MASGYNFSCIQYTRAREKSGMHGSECRDDVHEEISSTSRGSPKLLGPASKRSRRVLILIDSWRRKKGDRSENSKQGKKSEIRSCLDSLFPRLLATSLHRLHILSPLCFFVRLFLRLLLFSSFRLLVFSPSRLLVSHTGLESPNITLFVKPPDIPSILP